MMADSDQDQPPPHRPQSTWVPDEPWQPSPIAPRRALNAHSTFVPAPPETLTVALSGGAMAQAKAGATVSATSAVAADGEVVRAPFSEAGIAERLAADPEFYRRLATYVASELRAYAASIDTERQANVSHDVKGRVIEIGDDFDEAAAALETQDGLLTPAAAAKAASIVSKARNAYTALCSDHPYLLKVAKICFVGMALFQFGHVPEGWAGLIAYAVVEGVKLPEFMGPKGKDKDEP